MRTRPEWIGKNDDAAIPSWVRVRVFEKYGGICQLTSKRLMAGEYDLDHIIALADGGEHRESNLWPVLRKEHRKKTAVENKLRAKVKRTMLKHFQPRPESKWPKRQFSKPRYDNTKFIERF
jgi:5-methylcytosine-specific restriction endonuclease McrA